MNEFKAGDKVKMKDGSAFTNGNLICDFGSYCTTSPDVFVWIDEINEWFHTIDIELAHSNPPHKHKELIIAWAGGAEIQFKTECGTWVDFVSAPTWDETSEYRLKPQKTKLTTEIENIESDMRKLADRLNDLKGNVK